MRTGFALVLRFCGVLGYGFVGGADFGDGTGNGARFGDGNSGCDGRSGKSGGGLESERFRFGFGFRHLGRFDFAVNNIMQVVIAADDEQRLAKRVGEEILNGVRIRSFFVNGFVAVVVAVRVNGGEAVADIEFAGDVVAAELDIIHKGGRAVVEDIADGKRDGEISSGNNFIVKGDDALCQAGFGGEEPVVLGFELADGGIKSFFGSDFSFKVSHGKQFLSWFRV